MFSPEAIRYETRSHKKRRVSKEDTWVWGSGIFMRGPTVWAPRIFINFIKHIRRSYTWSPRGMIPTYLASKMAELVLGGASDGWGHDARVKSAIEMAYKAL